MLPYVPERPHVRSAVIIGPLSAIPIGAGVLVALAGFPAFSLPAMVAVAIWMYRRHKRVATTPTYTLRVEGGNLHIHAAGARVPRTVRLDDLLEVSLDSKTVERLQEASGGFPELRFINSTIAPPVENARIELELLDESIFLTEHHTSYLDASEWFGKIRRFLRKNGWVPEDERR